MSQLPPDRRFDPPPRLSLARDHQVDGAAVGYYGLLTYETWGVAVDKYEVGEFIMGTYSVPIWPTRFLVPIGCGAIALFLLVKGLFMIRSLASAEGGTSGA